MISTVDLSVSCGSSVTKGTTITNSRVYCIAYSKKDNKVGLTVEKSKLKGVLKERIWKDEANMEIRDKAIKMFRRDTKIPVTRDSIMTSCSIIMRTRTNHYVVFEVESLGDTLTWVDFLKIDSEDVTKYNHSCRDTTILQIIKNLPKRADNKRVVVKFPSEKSEKRVVKL